MSRTDYRASVSLGALAATAFSAAALIDLGRSPFNVVAHARQGGALTDAMLLYTSGAAAWVGKGSQDRRFMILTAPAMGARTAGTPFPPRALGIMHGRGKSTFSDLIRRLTAGVAQ